LTADGQSGTVQLLTGVMSSPLSFGSIFVQARINVDGGNSTGDRGARGGNIQFDCIGPVGGSVTIEPGSVLTANGGRGAGSGAGGSGGRLAISTLDDAVSISGTYTARGGNAGAGTGGDGGFVEVLTDDDNDDLGGAITIQTGAVLDISGGAGTIGGSARNGILNEAVILDADGLNGDDPANGIVINNGSIIARGGNPDGAGGDVIFDGLKANGTADPLPGLQDLDGAGPTPTNGTFQAF
jgi:hypothetical protein